MTSVSYLFQKVQGYHLCQNRLYPDQAQGFVGPYQDQTFCKVFEQTPLAGRV